jgi:hypothetical protein
MPAEWSKLNPKTRAKLLAEWKKEAFNTGECRRDRPEFLPADAVDAFNAALEAARALHSPKVADAPPIATIAFRSGISSPDINPDDPLSGPFSCFLLEHTLQEEGFLGHNDKVQWCWGPSYDFCALVHMPIDPRRIPQIPGAVAALNGEFQVLWDTPTWTASTVQERWQAKAESKHRGTHYTFCTLMEICHIKHAELDPKFHKYKGRLVMRGDVMKDEDGVMAVFSRQEASASKVEAARMLDAVARMAR